MLGRNNRFWHLSMVSSLYSWPICLNPKILRRSCRVFWVFSTVQYRLERRLAIDDFGTGYCSLAYLQRFPIDTIKIDQAFVKDLKLGKVDSPIMRAIIGMGRALKLHIVAEGVETRDQLAFLRMQGCEAYQGYLFSKPVPANQLQHFLRDRLSDDASRTTERLRNRLAS